MATVFGVLGDIEVRIDGRVIDVGHPRQRCVLAVLLVEANRVVASDDLLDRVWVEGLPQRARGVLSNYVSRLRRALVAADEVAIVRRSAGYLLSVDPTAVDLHRFRRLVGRARATDNDQAAAAMLEQALGLWRGEAFAGLDTPWLNTIRASLAAERLTVELDRNDLALSRGHHAGLVGGLLTSADTHPLDERVAGQLMLALYRSGRQADALDRYRQFQRLLAEELGADPGPTLRRLHHEILTADPGLTVPTPTTAITLASPIPRQLPAPPRPFVGRLRELARLGTALDTSDDRPTTLVVTAVSGTAGVGKTALAVHWAHQVADRFSDGQLYVNLRGFDPTGSIMDPAQALRTFLVALGVSAQRIPADQNAQVGLYRSLLAGKRMLVVLDNARDAEQARPLLPGAPGCLVIVTGRDQLTGLIANDGALGVTLDLLTTDEAYELLLHRLGPDRVEAEPDAVADIITRCARLPLALAIVAARAAAHPTFALHTVATQLHDAQLSAFDGGDPASDLRAVFSWSYHTLSPEARRLLRLLGLHPGPDISAAAAASLAAVPVPQGHSLLAELARAHLIVEATSGRYRFHDLLRAYATELTNTCDADTDRQAALHRMLDHYLHTAQSAALILDPQRDSYPLVAPVRGVTPEYIGGHGPAMAWLAAEHPVLLAAVVRAGSTGFEAHAWRLASVVATFFFVRGGYLHDWATVQRAALDAARRAADVRGQANAHRSLVLVYARMDRYTDAEHHGRHALDLYRELGDHTGQAHTNLHLGWMSSRQGRSREALGHSEDALQLYRSAGNRIGQANALNAVGWCHSQLGDYSLAVTICEQALDLLVQIDDRNGKAHTWDSLGHAHHHLDHHREAITSYEHALDLHRANGNRPGEADTLNHLGDAHHAAGDRHAAHNAWRSAMAILDEHNNPDADQIRAKLHGGA